MHLINSHIDKNLVNFSLLQQVKKKKRMFSIIFINF